jgi:23S rRNA (guanosine2251-2'-O)-methyltransferase
MMYIYGYHSVLQFLQSHSDRAVQVFMQKGSEDPSIEGICRDLNISISKVGKQKLDDFTHDGNHQGVVLHIRVAPPGNEKDLKNFCEDLPNNPLFLVLDGIQDPHNLGACLRSAAAFNCTGVIWAKDKQAQITPVVRKVACGAVDTLTLFTVTNLGRALQVLQEAGVWVVGTVLDPHSKPLSTIDLKGPIALVMGGEEDGLRHSTQKMCDFSAYIPISGSMQSLNVSVATGVSLYEVARQRKA